VKRTKENHVRVYDILLASTPKCVKGVPRKAIACIWLEHGTMVGINQPSHVVVWATIDHTFYAPSKYLNFMLLRMLSYAARRFQNSLRASPAD
jgi:hypothetical protein